VLPSWKHWEEIKTMNQQKRFVCETPITTRRRGRFAPSNALVHGQIVPTASPGGRNGIRKVPDKGDNVVNTGALLEREGAPGSSAFARWRGRWVGATLLHVIRGHDSHHLLLVSRRTFTATKARINGHRSSLVDSYRTLAVDYTMESTNHSKAYAEIFNSSIVEDLVQFT